MRTFQLGEWLPEAMTPLVADWLLERLEHGYLQATRHHIVAALGFPTPPSRLVLHRHPHPSPSGSLVALVSGRGRLAHEGR